MIIMGDLDAKVSSGNTLLRHMVRRYPTTLKASKISINSDLSSLMSTFTASLSAVHSPNPKPGANTFGFQLARYENLIIAIDLKAIF